MDFETVKTRIPSGIGDIRVLLEVKKDRQESIEYTVQILDADGNTMGHKQGDLAPYLTTAQISGARALMADVRTKAQKLIQ